MSRFNIFLILEFIAKNFFLALISIYRYIIKPFLGGRASCRFNPSCSEYAAQSFKNFSVFKAIKVTTMRLLKCHPFGSYGYDPIPEKAPEKTA